MTRTRARFPISAANAACWRVECAATPPERAVLGERLEARQFPLGVANPRVTDGFDNRPVRSGCSGHPAPYRHTVVMLWNRSG